MRSPYLLMMIAIMLLDSLGRSVTAAEGSIHDARASRPSVARRAQTPATCFRPAPFSGESGRGPMGRR